jgi:hypothetical protein
MPLSGGAAVAHNNMKTSILGLFIGYFTTEAAGIKVLLYISEVAVALVHV